MIEIWIKNHLVSDNSCNIVIYNNQIIYKAEWQIILGLQVVLVTLQDGLQEVLSKTNRSGDTKFTM